MYTKVYVTRSDDQSKNKSIIHVCVKEVSWVKEVYYTVTASNWLLLMLTGKCLKESYALSIDNHW